MKMVRKISTNSTTRRSPRLLAISPKEDPEIQETKTKQSSANEVNTESKSSKESVPQPNANADTNEQPLVSNQCNDPFSAILNLFNKAKPSTEREETYERMVIDEDDDGGMQMGTTLTGAWSTNDSSLQDFSGTSSSHENSDESVNDDEEGCDGGGDDNNVEESESQTFSGRTDTTFWQTRQLRSRKKLTKKMGNAKVIKETVKLQTNTKVLVCSKQPVIRLKRLQHPEIGFFTKPKVTECSRKSSDASLNQLSGGKSGETGIALSGAWSTPQMSKESSTNDGNSQANQQDDTLVQQPQVTINESPQSSSPQPSDENEVENGTGGSENLSGQSSSKDFLGTPPSHQNSDVVYNQEDKGDEDGGNNIEEIESRTFSGGNDTAQWQTSQLRAHKQLITNMGNARVTTEFKRLQTNTKVKSLIPCRPIQHIVPMQPKVLDCFRESSELHLAQLFGGTNSESSTGLSKESSITDSNLQAKTPENQHDDLTVQLSQATINESPQLLSSSSPQQPSYKDEIEIFTNDLVNSINEPNLNGFLGTQPSRQIPIDEQEKEEEETEWMDINEDKEQSDDKHAEEVQSRASTSVNDTARQQTSHRRPRKQAKPIKRKDRVAKEILECQSGTQMLIPRLPFQRLVHEIMQHFKNDFRLHVTALECLRESSESYLVQLFEDANLVCYHRSRVTLNVNDMRLVQVLRGANNPGFKRN